MTGTDEADSTGLTSNAMSPAQSRAARGLLGWTTADLAAKIGIDEKVIRDFEQGTGDPGSGWIEAVRSSLMASGIIFLGGNEPGVRLSRRGRDEGTRLDALTTENDR